MTDHPLFRFASATPVAIVSALVIIALLVLPAAQDWFAHERLVRKYRMSPPAHDWVPTSVAVEGNTLIVSGTFRRAHDGCQFVKPPRAHDETGAQYLIESRSPTAGFTYPALAQPIKFGPWVCHGCAGKIVSFYLEYACEGLPVFAPLGTVDARGLQ